MFIFTAARISNLNEILFPKQKFRQFSVILPSRAIATFSIFMLYLHTIVLVGVLQFLTQHHTLLTLRDHLHIVLILFELHPYIPNGAPFFPSFSFFIIIRLIRVLNRVADRPHLCLIPTLVLTSFEICPFGHIMQIFKFL
jgi:hypothetical protein